MNSAPITVFIDSFGGSPYLAEALRGVLSSPDQSSFTPCRIITVATIHAASAAADLLSSGDYAIAYRDCIIHFHGTRKSTADPLTVQSASSLIESLKGSNDRYAMELARRSTSRLMLRYAWMRSDFEKHREIHGEAKDDLDCFTELLHARLSPRAAFLVNEAKVKYLRYRTLHSHMLSKQEFQTELDSSTTIVEYEALLLKAVIDYRLQFNEDSSWTIREGLHQLNDDFLLLRDSIMRHADPQLEALCNSWGAFVLTAEQTNEIDLLPEPAKREKRLSLLRPIFQPLWFYFVALCQTLQDGEFGLTATDAYWLGLIDEVAGADLPTLRLAFEHRPDSPRGANPVSPKKKRTKPKP